MSDIDETNYNGSDLFIETFNNNAQNYTVDITANYTDGSTLTKTLQFKCEKSEDGKSFLVCYNCISVNYNLGKLCEKGIGIGIVFK